MKMLSRQDYRQVLLQNLDKVGLPNFTDRWDLNMILNEPDESDCISDGSVSSDSLWSPSSRNLTVQGNLEARFVDLRRRQQDDWDGGSLFVFGNVNCSAMRLYYNTFVFVLGSLTAEECLITAYEDAGIVVVGNLITKFLHGHDIWVELGGTARMDYGTGYCLPQGYAHSKNEEEMRGMVVSPIYGRDISLAVLPDEAKSDFNGEYIDTNALWNYLATGGRLKA